jgi:hypothetical protein
MSDEARIVELIREGDGRSVGAANLDEIRRRGRRLRTLRRVGYTGAAVAVAMAIGAPIVAQGPGGGDRPAGSVAGSLNITETPPTASDPRFRIDYSADNRLGPDDPGAEYVLATSAGPDFDAAIGDVVDLGYGLYGPYKPDRGRLWAQRTEMVSGDQRTYLFLGDRFDGHYYADEDDHRRNIAEPGPWGPLNIRWFLVPTKPYQREPDWTQDDPFTALFVVYPGHGVASAKWVRSDGTEIPLHSSTDVVPGATVLWGRTGADDTDTTGRIVVSGADGDEIASCTLHQCGLPWTDQSYGGPR